MLNFSFDLPFFMKNLVDSIILIKFAAKIERLQKRGVSR